MTTWREPAESSTRCQPLSVQIIARRRTRFLVRELRLLVEVLEGLADVQVGFAIDPDRRARHVDGRDVVEALEPTAPGEHVEHVACPSDVDLHSSRATARS
jgi:hypothetical protein